jgi:hypothetical protein
MERELNYLSEKTEEIKCKIAELRDSNHYSVDVRIQILRLEKELHILNNITSAITIAEITNKA